MAEEVARFSLKVDADAEPAAEAASELEKFRKAIEKSQGSIAEYQKSLRLLRGSSEEVKDAKEKLKAAIEAERQKVSQANLAILKLGSSYERLAKAAKKNTGETNAGRKAINAVGGPVKDLADKFDGLKGLLPALASGWGLVAAAVAVAVAGIALAAATVAGLTVKFTEWLLTTADANRNLQLTREAFSGSAKNATAWGHVIDWASEKTALTTQQMNDLVVATEKTYRGFRISGQGMVDAFKAQAAAAGAGRSDVAAFFDEIIQRGKMTGRSFVGFGDFAKFRNAGLDVKQLYKELGITSTQAMQGAVVSTDRMAAALRKLSENRFADMNAKKMLSLGSQWDRLKDNFMRFTEDLSGEGGALEPLLKAIQQIAMSFDLTTQSGQDLKATITQYGKALADAIIKHLPDIKAFVVQVIKLGGAFIEGVTGIVRWTQSADGMRTIHVIFTLIHGAIVAVVDVIKLLVAGFESAMTVADTFVQVITKIFQKLDMKGIGSALVDGIKAGLFASWNGLKDTVTSMAEGIKKTFKSALHIASPSKDFAKDGYNITQGAVIGIKKGTPLVTAATSAMASEAKGAAASLPSSSSASSDGGSSRTLSIGRIENHFNIHAKDGEAVKQVLSSDSFLSRFEESLRSIVQMQGATVGVTTS